VGKRVRHVRYDKCQMFWISSLLKFVGSSCYCESECPVHPHGKRPRALSTMRTSEYINAYSAGSGV
jgi:hypothetical protein